MGGEPTVENEERYCLPAGYRPRNVATTNDTVSGSEYWTPKRVRTSSLYQFSVYRYVLSLVRRDSPRSLLDVGCGVASKLEYIHERAKTLPIIGIDQPSPIRYCAEHYSFGQWIADDLSRPDLQKWPVADLTVCSDVIEHLPNPAVLLEAMKRPCSEGGVLVISTPERDRRYGRGCLSPGHPEHVREWNASEFRAYLESRGFEVMRQFYAAPVKLAPSRALLNELWAHRHPGKRFRSNQVCVVRQRV